MLASRPLICLRALFEDNSENVFKTELRHKLLIRGMFLRLDLD